MTTDTPAFEASRPLRDLNLRRLALRLGLGFVALIVIGAIIAFTYAALNAGKVLPGVTIAGMSVAGLDPAAAEQRLRTKLPDVRSGALNLEIGSLEHRILYSEIGRDYDIDAIVSEAMSVGRGGNPIEQLIAQVGGMFGGVDLQPTVSFDSELLSGRVSAVAHAAQVTPTNATITLTDGSYFVTPGQDGMSVDVEEVVAQALAAVSGAATTDTWVVIEPTVIPADVATPAAEAAVARAELVIASPLILTAASQSSTISQDTLRQWVTLEETSPGVWTLIVDSEPARALVAQLKAQVDQPAVEAEFRFDGGEPVAVAGAVGYELNAIGSVDAIVAALTGRADGTAVSQVTLPVDSTEPAFTTAQVQALVGRVELLGSWTTNYVPSPRNNDGINIRRPTELIDGFVVQPGGEFDFIDVAGPITRANGYGDGAAIIRGNTREEGVLGGGLCSASTTIYNAALRAGFQLGARRNHAYYIDRYPVGLDATIWISGSYRQTVEFFNDSEYPVVIRGINKKRKVTYEIWGVSDGRTVSLSDAVVTNEREASEFFEFTDSLPGRVTERKEYRADGFTSVVTRTVRDAAGNVIHTDTIRSSYRRVDGIILVGRVPGDPAAGTRIPADFGLPPAPRPEPTDPPSPDPDPTRTPRPTRPGDPDPTKSPEPTTAPTPAPSPTDSPSP